MSDAEEVAERKMFIVQDEDGNLVNPENVPIIVEKLVDGTLPLPRFTAIADKLITLPLWAEQHALWGLIDMFLKYDISKSLFCIIEITGEIWYTTHQVNARRRFDE